MNFISGGSILFASGAAFFPVGLFWCKDEKVLDRVFRKSIEEQIDSLSQKLEIDKKIELIERRSFMFGAQAHGSMLFPGTRVGILIDSDLADEIDPHQREFLLAHELSHIKRNDVFWLSAFSGFVGMVVTWASTFVAPSLERYPSDHVFFKCLKYGLFIWSPSAFLGQLSSLVTFIFYSRYVEEKADRLALSICSDEGKKGAIEFFDEIRSHHKKVRNEGDSFFERCKLQILLTEDGDFRFDVVHPSLKKRIAYCAESLAEKG